VVEWLQYTVEVKSKTTFDVVVRYASNAWLVGKPYLEDKTGEFLKQ
jgi:hypothetical protein